MKIIVHPSQHITFGLNGVDGDATYGKHDSFLNELKHNASRGDIIITDPESYDPRCRKFSDLVPFKVLNDSNILVDHVQSIHYQEGRSFEGAAKLIKLLEKKKVGKEEEIGICGQQLWYIDKVIINGELLYPPQLLLGDVARYYNTLFQEGYRPKIIRKLCYPTKDPPGFIGKF
jgi:hypothetical protein